LLIHTTLVANKGFWAELLGVGDFYYELGVQIVEICMAKRQENGGFMDIMELQRLLKTSRQAQHNSLEIAE